jgi:hypothetical protein
MPNEVPIMGHEHIERNTDQGGCRGCDDDAATARATARRQKIWRRRHEDRSGPFALMCWYRNLSARVLGRRSLDREYCGSRRAVRHLISSRSSPATPAHPLVNGFRCVRQPCQNLWMTLARGKFDKSLQKRQSTSARAGPVQVDGQSVADGPCLRLGLRPSGRDNRRGERSIELACKTSAVLAESSRSKIRIELGKRVV